MLSNNKNESVIQPNPNTIIREMNLEIPLLGFYDAPNPSPFEPLIRTKPGTRICIFAYYKRWLRGDTLHLTKENHGGCAGCGNWLFNVMTRSYEDYIKLLWEISGIRSSRELTEQWFNSQKRYSPEYPNIFIGPLKPDQYKYLKSVTFFINPDQLSMLIAGARYERTSSSLSPIITPFGSGCAQLATLFDDLNEPQAIIGATDIAMRHFLPPDVLAFTVTRSLFEQICKLDEKSFLYKGNTNNLKKVRAYKAKHHDYS